jgi:ProP effector
MTDPTDIITILAEWFPQAFSVYEARRRPLKVGIRHDILERTGGAIDPRELSHALSVYTANLSYLQRSARPGAIRIDLDGQPAGEVTREQAAHIRGRLLARKGIKHSVPAPDSDRIEPQPPPTKRSSLADLRAAAVQRQAASGALPPHSPPATVHPSSDRSIPLST